MDPVVCADVPSWWQVSVLPGASRAFNFSIMAEHLMGTHWYHAHKHGSVSLQVIGGLAGLIIMQPSNDYLAALPVDLAALCTFVVCRSRPFPSRGRVPLLGARAYVCRDCPSRRLPHGHNQSFICVYSCEGMAPRRWLLCTVAHQRC